MSSPPRRPQIQIGAAAKSDNFWQPVCYAEAEISISELLFIEQSDNQVFCLRKHPVKLLTVLYDISFSSI